MSWTEIQVYWAERLIVLILICCLVVAGRNLRHRQFAKLRGCQPSYRKFPVKDPFIGLDFIYENLLRESSARTLEDSCRVFRQLGPTYTVNRWTSQAVHTCDSRNIKYMLASGFEDFKLPNVRISVMNDLLGTGIFTLDGQSWSQARAVLRPALTTKKMGLLPSILECHVQALFRKIPRGNIMVDLQPLFFGATMDIATEFLMGNPTGMLDSNKQTDREQQFVDDYMLCSEEATKKMRLGPLHRLRFCATAGLAKKRVFAYVDKYIGESLERQRKASQWEPNFMWQLASEFKDRKMLRDQVLHILLASRDTTASLLSNLFFVLAKKPHIYAKLRDEVLDVAGASLPTFEQLKDMTYLKRCINESLRVHPVIPLNARQATRDTALPHGGGEDGESPLFVRKGTVVLYNTYSMHRDGSIFGKNPKDFVPERWDGLRPGWNYLPFNGGPRVCIGQQFALLETYYIVSRVVQTFQGIEARDGREWEELSALATTCKNGVHVSFKET